MGMIWKGTHVLIKGPTADNAYQSKNQGLGSKELSVEIRNRFVSGLGKGMRRGLNGVGDGLLLIKNKTN